MIVILIICITTTTTTNTNTNNDNNNSTDAAATGVWCWCWCCHSYGYRAASCPRRWHAATARRGGGGSAPGSGARCGGRAEWALGIIQRGGKGRVEVNSRSALREETEGQPAREGPSAQRASNSPMRASTDHAVCEQTWPDTIRRRWDLSLTSLFDEVTLEFRYVVSVI